MTTPEPLTDGRLAAIEARCQAATPGPWSSDARFGVALVWASADPSDECASDALASLSTGVYNDGHIGWVLPDEPRQDADFIAHSRADVPDLVAEVKRLRALVDAGESAAWTRGYYAGRLAGWDLANTGTPRSAIPTGEGAEGGEWYDDLHRRWV